MKHAFRRLVTVAAALCVIVFAVTLATTSGCAAFGAVSVPHTESPHYDLAKDQFENLEPTGVMREGQGAALREFFGSDTMRVPTCPLPLSTPQLSSPPASGLRITWLGHSTSIIEIDGATILTDPMFSERASPSTVVGPKRFHAPPLALAELPRIDAVIVSHDHYDHLDMESIKALAQKVPRIVFHTGLGVGRHLAAWGVDPAQIIEHDWEYALPIADTKVQIISSPARHFSGRRGFGNNRTLWTSWSLVGPVHRVFFSGDTGLTQSFATTADKHGPFDVAMLEIGQWHPAWGDIHLGPQGALEAFGLLRAKKLLPIHWATFELGLHAWSEPPETLTVSAEARGLAEAVITPRLGESVEPLTATTTRWWRAYPPMATECPR